MQIVLTNDDGIEAPGIHALHEAVQGLGDIQVLAPAGHESAASHAVTFNGPLTVEKRTIPANNGWGAFEGTAIGGRPADCIKLGLATLIDHDVDLVLSGINAGANVGINIIYSGTVAAAREAAIIGKPAIALSLHLADFHNIRWGEAGRQARIAIDRLLELGMASAFSGAGLINVNIPILDGGREPKGIRVTRACALPLIDVYEPCRGGLGDQNDGKDAFQITSTMTFQRHDPGTDVEALFAGYITVTPLLHQLTDVSRDEVLRQIETD